MGGRQADLEQQIVRFLGRNSENLPAPSRQPVAGRLATSSLLYPRLLRLEETRPAGELSVQCRLQTGAVSGGNFADRAHNHREQKRASRSPCTLREKSR